MLSDPALTMEERSPARPEGKGRGLPPSSEHHTPFDTSGAAHYPDPPKVGKGKEIQDPSGKKRVDVKVCEYDLDQLAQRKATARCGPHSDKTMPEILVQENRSGRTLLLKRTDRTSLLAVIIMFLLVDLLLLKLLFLVIVMQHLHK